MAGLALALASCSDSGPGSSGSFRFYTTPPADSVWLEIAGSAGLAQAESLLGSGEARWATGLLVGGDGGFNPPWHWHLDPESVEFAEATIEACQTSPSGVEADLDYWIRFGRVCYWGVVQRRER